MAKLYDNHPEYRTGSEKITLTMMGGSRDAGDETRLEGLRTLAKNLGIDVSSDMRCLVILSSISAIHVAGWALTGIG